MSAGNSSSPATPGASERGDGGSNIKDSIAALRSILMIDTPTKSLLSGQHPSVAAQQSQCEERKVQWDQLAKLRDTTSELKHRVQEATHEAANETRKRKTLQTAYDALAKHKKELSMQLELVTKSREASEERLEALRKTLSEERAAIANERVQWKPDLDRLSREKTKFQQGTKTLQTRCHSAEQKVKELEGRVKLLESELAQTKAVLERNQSSQAALQPRVDQSETARRKAEASLSQLRKELDTIKRRHRKSLGSMLENKQDLKKQLAEAQAGRKAAEKKLEQTLKEKKNAENPNEGAKSQMNVVDGESQRQGEPSRAAAEEQVSRSSVCGFHVIHSLSSELNTMYQYCCSPNR